MKNVICLFVIVTSISSLVFGSRQLEEAEVLTILQEVTSNPKETWIDAGSIEAIREEYKAARTTDQNEIKNKISQKIADYQNICSDKKPEHIQKMELDAIPFNTRYRLENEYTMTTSVSVKYDGERYYKEVNVESRTDSIKPDKELADNSMTNEFNLKWNAKRIFAWDGQNYTTHSSGNHAVVDSSRTTPPSVNGLLTVGIIPWGRGIYTYENLINSEVTATEDILDGQALITLTINNLNGIFMTIVLDANKNYAPISHKMEFEEAIFENQYDNYVSINGNWVPTTILLEVSNLATNQLVKRNLWNFTTIDGSTPEVDSFEVEFDDNTIVEHKSSVANKSSIYNNNLDVDTDELLAKRLTYAANESVQKQNCATASLKYALEKLGTDVTDSQLAELVGETNGETSLLKMKLFAENLGVYCQAITTDLDTLKELDNCQVILHIPGKNHFVVLESIDDKFVRVIDLANNKFYYKTDINFFDMDWTGGVALLISNSGVTGSFNNINNEDLINITGAYVGGYTCTLVYQTGDEDYVDCVKIGGICEGVAVDFEERYGCESAGSGTCTTGSFKKSTVYPCINNPEIPSLCTIVDEEDAIIYYMSACS